MTSVKIFLPAMLAGLLAACGPADPPPATSPDSTASDAPAERLVIRGELFYPERIALPPDSIAIVELRVPDEFDGTLLATTRIELGTRQVPIDFELSKEIADLPEAGPFAFRAGIRSHPGPIRLTETIGIEQRAGEVDLGSLRLQPVPRIALGASYRCGEQTVVFGALGDYQRLVVDDEVFDLQPEIAASGARYIGVGENGIEFWSKGDEAMVTIRGEALDNCERVAEPELPFTARGQEPGWNLRIDDTAMVLHTNYDEQKLNFSRAPAEISAAGIRYETENEGRHLSVLIEREACNDTMADVAYPYSVQYTLDGDTQTGCGGDPREVLGGSEWLIEEIGGQAIAEGSAPTIEFLRIDGEDRFAGRASCNRYMGGYRLTGEGINLSPAASTMMACAEEDQALQERRLLSLLEEVYGFGIDSEGRLHLRAGSGEIIARR